MDALELPQYPGPARHRRVDHDLDLAERDRLGTRLGGALECP